MKRQQTQTTDCDTCAGNRQLLEQIRQDVAALSEQIGSPLVATLESIRVEVASLGPDDYVVFTAAHRLSDEEISELMCRVKRTMPGVKVIILDGGLRVSVIHPDGAQ